MRICDRATGAAEGFTAEGAAGHGVATGRVAALGIASGSAAGAARGIARNAHSAGAIATIGISVSAFADAAGAAVSSIAAVAGHDRAGGSDAGLTTNSNRADNKVRSNVNRRRLGAAAVAGGRVTGDSGSTDSADTTGATRAANASASRRRAAGATNRAAAGRET